MSRSRPMDYRASARHGVQGTLAVGVAMAVTAVLAVSAPVAGSASGPLNIAVSPQVVTAGTKLAVTDSGSCTEAATATVKAPQGEGAVATGSAPAGSGWTIVLDIPSSVPPGGYVVVATCGSASYDPVDITIVAPAAKSVPGSPSLTG